jgi:hypothetical protein
MDERREHLRDFRAQCGRLFDCSLTHHFQPVGHNQLGLNLKRLTKCNSKKLSELRVV